MNSKMNQQGRELSRSRKKSKPQLTELYKPVKAFVIDTEDGGSPPDSDLLAKKEDSNQIL